MAVYSKIALLINPRAGRGEGKELLAGADDIIRAAGLNGRIWGSGLPWDEAFFEKAAREADLLVICGGDGSVHHAVNGLNRLGITGRTLAYYPIGTGNDLQKSLAIPKRPLGEHLAKLADNPYHKKLDCFFLNGTTLFTNYVSFGFDAWLAEKFDTAVKRMEGHPLFRLPLAKKALWAALGLPAFLTYRERMTGPNGRGHFSIVVGNINRYGGGSLFAETGSPDDGRPERAFYRTRWQWLPLALNRSIAAGLFDTGAETVNPPLTLAFESPPPVQVDGEYYGKEFAGETRFEIQHHGTVTVAT